MRRMCNTCLITFIWELVLFVPVSESFSQKLTFCIFQRKVEIKLNNDLITPRLTIFCGLWHGSPLREKRMFAYDWGSQIFSKALRSLVIKRPLFALRSELMATRGRFIALMKRKLKSWLSFQLEFSKWDVCEIVARKN